MQQNFSVHYYYYYLQGEHQYCLYAKVSVVYWFRVMRNWNYIALIQHHCGDLRAHSFEVVVKHHHKKAKVSLCSKPHDLQQLEGF